MIILMHLAFYQKAHLKLAYCYCIKQTKKCDKYTFF